MAEFFGCQIHISKYLKLFYKFNKLYARQGCVSPTFEDLFKFSNRSQVVSFGHVVLMHHRGHMHRKVSFFTE